MKSLNLDFPGWRSQVVCSFLVLLGIGIVNFLVRLFRVRSKFQRMQKDGLPMPPHHPLLGHLKLLGEITSKLPSDIHGHVIPHQIKLLFPDLGPTFYIDAWPFGPQMLVVTSPDQAHQITQIHSLPKFHALGDYMRPMTGGNDLISLEGKEWKKWRGIFNPGFSTGHLMTLVPEIMEEMEVFCGRLREVARKKEVVLLDNLMMGLSLDVIGRMVLDTRLNSQLKTNNFISAMRNQIKWLSFGNEIILFKRYNPFRPLMKWWNNRIMIQFIHRELDLRFKSKHLLQNQNSHTPRNKTIIDLALNTYLANNPEKKTSIDTTFLDSATSQIRAFLFAGHDTTSSTMSYTLHLLSLHPQTLQNLITEHDKILGPNSTLKETIQKYPYLLNQLPYTLAVIKETLRLYPPASSTRSSSEPGYSIPGVQGNINNEFPTSGFLIWVNSYAIHHDSNLWPLAEKFLPERWIVEEGNLLFPVKGAWRPFEFGPRNCIGQELAMLELKLLLVVTARSFEIKSVYDEGLDGVGDRGGAGGWGGDGAYQVLEGSAHPKGGMPCRVGLVGGGGVGG